MTRVVNLRKENYEVYIGRPGMGIRGQLGNPVSVGEKCGVCGLVHSRPGETIPCHDVYMRARISLEPEFEALVRSCRGRTLGCFCAPKPCHGDNIVRWLDENP